MDDVQSESANGSPDRGDETANRGSVPRSGLAGAVEQARPDDAIAKNMSGVISAPGDVSIVSGGAGAIVAQGDIYVKSGGAAAMIAGGDMAVTQGGGQVMIAGGSMRIQEGGGGILIAGGHTTIEKGFVGVALSGRVEVRDGGRLLLGTPQAIALGAALGLVFAGVDGLRRRRGKRGK